MIRSELSKKDKPFWFYLYLISAAFLEMQLVTVHIHNAAVLGSSLARFVLN